MVEIIDPVTGEVFPDEHPAADGRPLAPTATTLSQFIAVLANGEFDRGMADVLSRLIEEVRDVALSDAGSAKAKLAIAFDIKLENEVWLISPSYKLTMPAEKWPRGMMFTTADNRFTPNPPMQGQLFGVRDVTPGRRVRDI